MGMVGLSDRLLPRFLSLICSLDPQFAHNGQVCVASSRVYVQKSIADKFLEKYKVMTQAQKPGDVG